MRQFTGIAVILIFITSGLNAQEVSFLELENWSQWRGPYANGVAPGGNPPLEWSEDLNIKWKAEIPGVGHATPIIWEDQIFLLSAIQTDQKATQKEGAEEGEQNDWMNPTSTEFIHQFAVISLDRNSGELNWKTIVREELPFSHTHQFGSWASNSPVTDGDHVYAYFGSHGLYCLNMEGKLVWEHDFGRMEKVMSFGEGSSPTLFKDNLIILRDHQGQSSLHVLDKHDGKVKWEFERDEISSWSTPAVIEYDGLSQLITSATNSIRSYNVESGELLWKCSGLTRNVIPSPLFENGLLYLMSGFRGSALLAIDLSKASGDITDSEAIAWKYDRNTPYTPNPVLLDGLLYFLKANNGYLTCLDAADGTEHYTSQKLDGINNIFTSPVAMKNRIYIAGTNGTFCVVKAGKTFGLLSQNKLEDNFYASPVILGNSLYLRGVHSLYCVSKE